MSKPQQHFKPRSAGDKAAKVDRTESAFLKERERIRALNEEKTTRLRTLRLAKEATDRAAREALALATPARELRPKKSLK